MNNYFKFNKNLKFRKATVILLSLFLLFFISSIIGIIYSYNKRIFQLAKQERDNYKVFKKQFDEMFTNLYMIDFLHHNNDWTTKLKILKSFSISEQSSFSFTANITIESVQEQIESIKPMIEITNKGIVVLSIENKNATGSSNCDSLVDYRKQIFNDLKNPNSIIYTDIKNEIIENLKNLIGQDIEILEFNLNLEPSNFQDSTKSVIGTYDISLIKKIKLKNNKEITKKFNITLRYEFEIPIFIEAEAPIKYNSIGTPIEYDIYGNPIKFEHTYVGTCNGCSRLSTSSNLIEFYIKQVPKTTKK